MINKKLLTALIGMSSCLPFASNANNFSYNYFEITAAASPQTMGGEFSALIVENAHFIGKVSSQFDHDYDVAAGVGFNGPINQFVDVYGQFLLHNTKYTQDKGAERKTQPEFNIGMRVWLANQIEVTGRLGMLDESSVVHAGARFHSTEQLSLSAEVRNNGTYGSQMTMSVRFQY